MSQQKKLFFFIFLSVFVIFFPRPTRAVIPPDFIFNIGSTIAQVFSVIVLFFSAVFGVLYRYLKIRFARLFASKIFWILGILVLIIGSGSLAFWYASVKERAAFNAWFQQYRPQGTAAGSSLQYYFYDRLVFQGKDKNGQPVTLLFEGSRRELSGFYGHSYSAEAVYRGQAYDDYTSFTYPVSNLTANDFVKQFTHTKANELPEESYAFTLVMGGKKFGITIPHVGADFLVKNNLEYLRYVSAAPATITIDGEKISARVMIDRVLSTNAPLVTLQGYPDIKNTTHSIVFWDERGNFYHVDTSKVYTPNVPYYTHTWILYKNADGTTKQSQVIDITVHNSKSDTPNWDIALPEMNNAKIALKISKLVEKNSDGFSGIVEGEMQDGSGTKKVYGYGFYEDRR